LAINFINVLCQAAANEYDAEIIISQIHCIKEIVDFIGCFMNEQQVSELSDKAINLLLASDTRKAENELTK